MDRLDRAVLQRSSDERRLAFLIDGTIALATVSWAAAEVLKLRRPQHDRLARALWTAGALLAAAHAASAFHFAHRWSHRAAAAETARQTAALTGLDWSGGLYVNYAFLAVWAADAAWWWTQRDAYRARPRLYRTLLLALFVFMFVNGAIVFADGAMRVLGAGAVTAVVWTWYRSA